MKILKKHEYIWDYNFKIGEIYAKESGYFNYYDIYKIIESEDCKNLNKEEKNDICRYDLYDMEKIATINAKTKDELRKIIKEKAWKK